MVSVITDIVTCLQIAIKIRHYKFIGCLCRRTHDHLNIILGKKLLGTLPHTAGYDDVGALLV